LILISCEFLTLILTFCVPSFLLRVSVAMVSVAMVSVAMVSVAMVFLVVAMVS
jgi:hypothetical protein